MPHPVEIGIFFIARTNIDIEESNKWLDKLGAKEYIIDTINNTDAEAFTELAGRRCYLSYEKGMNPNVTKIRTDMADYIENILKSGHGSILEHITYSFAIEGISRVFTSEMNRHRAGWAISEGSFRYIRFEDMKYWLPMSIQEQIDEGGLIGDAVKLAVKKSESRKVFQRAFEDAEKHYMELQEIWKDELATESSFKDKKLITSMMRRIVPMGVSTGGIWTGNLRAIRHVITMRTTEAAEEEICYVFSNIIHRIAELEPKIFGDFKQDEHGFWHPLYNV